jgi:1-phosphofructokinase family hexose kinase
MILCITPNPAIDRTLLLPSLKLGHVHRAEKMIVAAGGKGLNVARSIRILGGHPLCMGFAGGHNGRLLADLAQNEGLDSSWTWTDSETRTCTILIPSNEDATVINESGTPVAAADWTRLRRAVRAQLSSVDRACISGSLPPRSAIEDFNKLLGLLVESGKQVWVDTSGAGLRAALAYPELCIKVNGHEIGETLGLDVDDVDSTGRALLMLEEGGQRASIITRGSAGAMLATWEGRWRAQGPRVQVTSTVGSGDSFMGGLLSALDAGKGWAEALCEAVAAGTANALSAGGGNFALEAFERIRGQVQVQAW